MTSTDKSNADRDTVQQAGKDARAGLHEAIDKTADHVQPAIDRLTSKAHEGVDQVGETLNDVSNAVAGGTRQLGDAYKRFAVTGRNYVRDRPTVSLLAAVAVGYGLSKLLGKHH